MTHKARQYIRTVISFSCSEYQHIKRMTLIVHVYIIQYHLDHQQLFKTVERPHEKNNSNQSSITKRYIQQRFSGPHCDTTSSFFNWTFLQLTTCLISSIGLWLMPTQYKATTYVIRLIQCDTVTWQQTRHPVYKDSTPASPEDCPCYSPD